MAVSVVSSPSVALAHAARQEITIQFHVGYGDSDADLRRVQEDMACLTAYARQQGWPRGQVQSLKSFLADLGVEPEGEA